MTKDEALRLALEALEKLDRVMKRSPDTDKAIIAIKQALEQPEPEPVACKHRIADVTNEVVKSGYMCMDCGALFGAYTFPPKREWQGLTEDEISKLVYSCDYDEYEELVRATEAKLKEKNT